MRPRWNFNLITALSRNRTRVTEVKGTCANHRTINIPAKKKMTAKITMMKRKMKLRKKKISDDVNDENKENNEKQKKNSLYQPVSGKHVDGGDFF